jgi:hypothetical protein
MGKPMNIPHNLNKAQKRLVFQYRHLGSWRAVSRARNVNIYYVYRFVFHGEIPTNYKIAAALGIPPKHKTINYHLSHDAIQDMPIPLLEWALLNREEL